MVRITVLMVLASVGCAQAPKRVKVDRSGPDDRYVSTTDWENPPVPCQVSCLDGLQDCERQAHSRADMQRGISKVIWAGSDSRRAREEISERGQKISEKEGRSLRICQLQFSRCEVWCG